MQQFSCCSATKLLRLRRHDATKFTTDGLNGGRWLFRPPDRPTEFRLNEYPDRPVPAQGRHRSLARQRRPADPFDLFPRSQDAQARRRAGAVQARSARPQGHSISSAASARTATRSSTSIARPMTRRRRARAITPAAQWLLDNHYLIEETVFQVKRDLPRRFYRELAGRFVRRRAAGAARAGASPGPMSRIPTARSRPRCSRRSSKATSRSSR